MGPTKLQSILVALIGYRLKLVSEYVLVCAVHTAAIAMRPFI